MMDRLRLSGLAVVLSAFAAGLGATWMWMQSNAQWTAHLNRAYVAGAALYDGLRLGDPVGDGFVMAPLPAAEQFLATKGDFDHLSNSPRPALITYVSIYAQPSDLAAGDHLTLAVLSADLQYPLADLHSGTAQPAWEVFAALSRTLASYCSEPVVIARMQDQPWVRITGPDVWDCTAAPADRRLAAAILGLAALGILATLVLDASARFTQFADALRSRRRLGGPGQYVAKGPKELRDIVSAVNGYLELEREQLAKRAIVLSGVSHDLGTPATRLKLRSALISDPALKTKIEADIDRMTGIIESVLTYTRTEMDTEAPRRLSLTSLIDAIVADYQDTGQPVEFRPQEVVMVEGGRSLFMSKRGHSHVPDQGRIIVTARPIALQRAVSNLIDNALKYGRRATVSLETDASMACITVEDEGGDTSVHEIEELMAPFQRGANTQSINGYGLGLTIAATVATLHGGALGFEPGPRGLRARLTIQR